MEKLRVNLKEIDGTLMIPVPGSIGEFMGWDDGTLLEVAFHEINKIPVKQEFVSSPEGTGKKEVIMKIREHEPKKVTQNDVIDFLENPTPEMSIYRTTYVKWKGKTYGVKNLCKLLFDHDDFNTQTGERCLKKLGFPIFKK